MAYNKAPSNWLGAGYTLVSNVAGFNTNDAASNKLLTKLTSAEANASTGDIREIMFAMLEAFYTAWQAKDSADRPTKLNISRVGTTTAAGNIIFNYNVQIEVATTAINVADEPV